MVSDIPGSKSILQRLMVLLAHAKGDICIRNYNPCNDVLELEAALKVFGFQVSKSEEEISFRFSEQAYRQSKHHYHFEASATAFRLWLSVMANQPEISSQIHVSRILFDRGIQPLCEALKDLGGELKMQDTTIFVDGAELKGGDVSISANLSSQYASSLLLTAPFMQKPLSLKPDAGMVSVPYLKLSADMLSSFGAKVELDEACFRIQRAGFALSQEFEVDSDLSTAAFYAVQAVLGNQVRELRLTLHPNYHQPDMRIWSILKAMGARIETEGLLYRVYPSEMQGIELDLTDNPDLMPVLCIAALFCSGSMRLRGIGRLIYKESNRVQGICRALDQLSAKYKLEDDAIQVWPLVNEPLACTLDTQEDHRLVMAFSLLERRFPQVQPSERASLSKSVPI